MKVYEQSSYKKAKCSWDAKSELYAEFLWPWFTWITGFSIIWNPTKGILSLSQLTNFVQREGQEKGINDFWECQFSMWQQ
jgi:hypothetical protein